MAGGFYHTGDVATRDDEGYITYVGRTDDVFKASDYKVSPFELESVLIEHPAVAEAAVVPAPDPVRLAVPKAYVVLAPGHEPTEDTARSILGYCPRAPAAVPPGAPARVRRAARRRSPARSAGSSCGPARTSRPSERIDGEWRDDQFPELKGPSDGQPARTAPSCPDREVARPTVPTGRRPGGRG